MMATVEVDNGYGCGSWQSIVVTVVSCGSPSVVVTLDGQRRKQRLAAEVMAVTITISGGVNKRRQ